MDYFRFAGRNFLLNDDGGVNPLTRSRVVESSICHSVLAVMATAGLYETSGKRLLRNRVARKERRRWRVHEVVFPSSEAIQFLVVPRCVGAFCTLLHGWNLPHHPFDLSNARLEFLQLRFQVQQVGPRLLRERAHRESHAQNDCTHTVYVPYSSPCYFWIPGCPAR